MKRFFFFFSFMLFNAIAGLAMADITVSGCLTADDMENTTGPLKRVRVKIDYESSPSVWIALSQSFFTDDGGCFTGVIQPATQKVPFRVRAVLKTDEFKILKRSAAWDIVFPGTQLVNGNSLDFGELHFEGDLQDEEDDESKALGLWFGLLKMKELYIQNIEPWPYNQPIKLRYHRGLEGRGPLFYNAPMPAWFNDSQNVIYITDPVFALQGLFYVSNHIPLYHEFGHWVQNQDHISYNVYNASFSPLHQAMADVPYHHPETDPITGTPIHGWQLNTYESLDTAYTEGFAEFLAILIEQGTAGCQRTNEAYQTSPSIPPFETDIFNFDSLPLHFESDHRATSVLRTLCDLVDTSEEKEIKTWYHEIPAQSSPPHMESVNAFPNPLADPLQAELPVDLVYSNLVADQNYAYGFVTDLTLYAPDNRLFRYTLTPGLETRELFLDGSNLFQHSARISLAGNRLCFLASDDVDDWYVGIFCVDTNTPFATPPTFQDLSQQGITQLPLPDNLNNPFLERPARPIDIHLSRNAIYLLGRSEDGFSQIQRLWLDRSGSSWEVLTTLSQDKDFTAFDLDENTHEVFISDSSRIYSCNYLTSLGPLALPTPKLEGQTGLCRLELFAGLENQKGYKRGPRLEAAFTLIHDIFRDEGKLYVVDMSGASAIGLRERQNVVQIAGQPATLGPEGGGHVAVMDHVFVNGLTQRAIPVGYNADPQYPERFVRYIHKDNAALFQTNVSLDFDSTSENLVLDPTIYSFSSYLSSVYTGYYPLVRIDETVPLVKQSFCGFEDVDLSGNMSGIVHMFAQTSQPNTAGIEDVLSDSGLLDDAQMEQVLSANWVHLKSPEEIAAEFNVECPLYEGQYLYE
ncbi:hypothetical protein K1X76_00725 [bacterium]|nr:hypothetical protein [bacterium]